MMRQFASGQVSEVPGDKKDENLHVLNGYTGHDETCVDVRGLPWMAGVVKSEVRDLPYEAVAQFAAMGLPVLP